MFLILRNLMHFAKFVNLRENILPCYDSIINIVTKVCYSACPNLTYTQFKMKLVIKFKDKKYDI